MRNIAIRPVETNCRPDSRLFQLALITVQRSLDNIQRKKSGHGLFCPLCFVGAIAVINNITFVCLSLRKKLNCEKGIFTILHLAALSFNLFFCVVSQTSDSYSRLLMSAVAVSFHTNRSLKLGRCSFDMKNVCKSIINLGWRLRDRHNYNHGGLDGLITANSARHS